MTTSEQTLYFSNFREACEAAKQNPGSIAKRNEAGDGFMVVLKASTSNHTSVAGNNDYNYRKQNDVLPIDVVPLDDNEPPF